MAHEGQEDEAPGEGQPEAKPPDDAWIKRTRAVVARHLDQLAGEFDTVQIFVTKFRPDADCTSSYNLGVGNWYARRGYIHDWTIKEDENSRMEAAERSILEELDDDCD